MSLITIDHISKEYKNQMVLQDVSFRVERGERVAFIGPNGSGKTTLLRIIAGKETCDTGNVIISRGTKTGYLTQDMNEMEEDEKSLHNTALFHKDVYFLEQRLRNLESKMALPETLKDPAHYQKIMAEYDKVVCLYEQLDGYTIESKIKTLLLGLGLKEEALTLPVEQLSGGERMRTLFARILLLEPDLLILDEPTNHLDIQATEWLENFLKKFQGGILFVSHDRYFLDQVATRIVELEKGMVTERSGSYSTFTEQKSRMRAFAQREQFRLSQEIKREATVAAQLKSQQKISAWKSRIKSVERLKKELTVNVREMKQVHHLYRTTKPTIGFHNARHISAEIAEVKNLSKSFDNTFLFQNISFLIQGGDKVGIIGPNGCGKTTLLNILLGKDTDYKGYARLGEWVKYEYLGQDINFSDERLTVMEQLLLTQEMDTQKAKDYLAGFQFYGDELNKQTGVLSGGERVRLYMACLMLRQPACLIMDEPTNHLDVQARDALEAAILKFSGTVIAISHDRFFLSRCVNRIFEFSNRSMKLYEGNYEVYRQKKEVNELSIQPSPASKANTRVKSHALSPSSNRTQAEDIEAKIVLLEEKKDLLEASFNSETPFEKYSEYQRLVDEIDQLYDLYTH